MTSTAIRSAALLLTRRARALPRNSHRARPTEPARSVTLSLAEYNRLIDLADRPPHAPPSPPVAAVLVERRSARARRCATPRAACSRSTGEVLRPGVSRVTLLVRRNADRRARRRPAAAARRRRHARTRRSFPDRARSRSTLEWGAPLTFSPGPRRRSCCRCRRPAPRARRSISPAIRPTSACRRTHHAHGRPQRPHASSRPRSIPDPRPRSGGRCATARRWRRRASSARSAT